MFLPLIKYGPCYGTPYEVIFHRNRLDLFKSVVHNHCGVAKLKTKKQCRQIVKLATKWMNHKTIVQLRGVVKLK